MATKKKPEQTPTAEVSTEAVLIIVRGLEHHELYNSQNCECLGSIEGAHDYEAKNHFQKQFPEATIKFIHETEITFEQLMDGSAPALLVEQQSNEPSTDADKEAALEAAKIADDEQKSAENELL